jgi:TP901 family phage tail tape measure protein
MANNEVKIRISAEDNASPTLKKVDEGLGGLSKTTKATKQDFAVAGAAISGAIIGIGATAVTKFADFEKTMSGVKAVLAPTKEEFDALSLKARQLGKDTTFSAQASAEAMEMLAKNGLTAKQILDGAADSSLALAAATGADLATAADISTSAMLSFGMSVKDLDKAVNGITGTTNISKFGIEDYSLALSQGGGVAASVGVNFSDFNASIAAISPLFASGSDAGTSFKTMLLRLVPQGDKARDAMKELGIITKDGKNQFFDATGKMKNMAEVSGILQKAFKGLSDEQKNEAMNTIFGTDALRAASALANTGSEEFTKLKTAIDSTDAAKNAKERLDNLNGSFEQLSGSVDELFITLGSMLAPAIRGIADILTFAANQLSNLYMWFQTLPGPIQQVVGVFASIVAGGTLLVAFWAVLTVTMGGVASAFVALAVAAGPWLLIAALVGAAIYALYLAWNSNFLGIQDITKAVFAYVMKVFQDAIVFWGTDVPAALAALWGKIKEVWAGIYASTSEVWDALKNYLEVLWKAITSVIDAELKVIGDIFAIFGDIFTGNWSKLWDDIKTLGADLWNLIRTTIVAVWDVFVADLQVKWAVFKTIFGGLWEAVKKVAVDAWNGIGNAIKGAWDSLTRWLTVDAKGALDTAFSAAMSGMAGIAKGILNGVISVFEGFINTAIDGINALIDAANAVSPIKVGHVARIGIGRLAYGGMVGQGYFGGSPLQALANGGVVSGSQGIDKVPILATAGEVVLNRAQQGRLASQLAGGGGMTLYVTVSGNNFYGDDASFAQKIGNTIIEDLKRHIDFPSF